MFRARVRTVQDCPHFARAAYVEVVDWAYLQLAEVYTAWDLARGGGDAVAAAAAELEVERRWALCLLLERLLLRTAAATGEAGQREFRERFEHFWNGEWDLLLADAAPPVRVRRRGPRRPPTLEERGDEARKHVQLGECSRARSRLDGSALAPGDALTCELLHERPAVPGPLGPPAPAPPPGGR